MYPLNILRTYSFTYRLFFFASNKIFDIYQKTANLNEWNDISERYTFFVLQKTMKIILNSSSYNMRSWCLEILKKQWFDN